MKTKQNQIFFHGTYSNLKRFFVETYWSISLTFKIKIYQVYLKSEYKPWEWNKISHFSMEHIQIWRNFLLVVKHHNNSKTFTIDTFQPHCKSEHNHVKWNKTTQDMCKSSSIFFNLQNSTLFKRLFEIYFLIRFMIKEKWTHLPQKNSHLGSIFWQSSKCVNRLIIKTF